MLWSCFLSLLLFIVKSYEERGKVSIEEIKSFQPNLPPKSVQIYVITFRALDLFANRMKNKHICILYSLKMIFWCGEILYFSRKHDLVLGPKSATRKTKFWRKKWNGEATIQTNDLETWLRWLWLMLADTYSKVVDIEESFNYSHINVLYI